MEGRGRVSLSSQCLQAICRLHRVLDLVLLQRMLHVKQRSLRNFLLASRRSSAILVRVVLRILAWMPNGITASPTSNHHCKMYSILSCQSRVEPVKKNPLILTFICVGIDRKGQKKSRLGSSWTMMGASYKSCLVHPEWGAIR